MSLSKSVFFLRGSAFDNGVMGFGGAIVRVERRSEDVAPFESSELSVASSFDLFDCMDRLGGGERDEEVKIPRERGDAGLLDVEAELNDKNAEYKDIKKLGTN